MAPRIHIVVDGTPALAFPAFADTIDYANAFRWLDVPLPRTAPLYVEMPLHYRIPSEIPCVGWARGPAVTVIID